MAEMEYCTRPVCSALRPYVADLMGYAYGDDPPALHRGLPSRFLTLVITLDEPLGVAWPGRPVEKYDALASGLHSTAVHIGQTPSRAGVQLSLTPPAARVLFGLPPGELASIVIGLDEVLGRPARELTEQLRGAPGWADRFDLLESALLQQLDQRRVGTTGPEVGWAWQRLSRSDGAIGVEELAREVGWSRRHLTDRFTAEYGLPPKVAARVLRFERATRLLRRQPGLKLADLAAVVGYADQPHLTREFRTIAGCTPRQWITEELPNLQDPSPGGSAMESNPQASAIGRASPARSH